MGVWNLRKLSPQVSLPSDCGPVATARARAGLAGVVHDTFFVVGGEDFGSKGVGSTVEHFPERLSRRWARVLTVPGVPGHLQQPSERSGAHPLHRLAVVMSES